MARFRQGLDLDQALLLPPSLRDWLPEDHLAWFVIDAVSKLDVDALLDRYRMSGKGELPYDPRMMLGLLIYAYATGTVSSRKIAAKLETDVAYRIIARGQRPDHRSICRFRTAHLDLFTEFFKQVLCLAAELSMLRFGTIAIDGTKLRANASKHKAMSYQRMLAKEEELLREIEEITKRAAGEDQAEDVAFGPKFRGDELPQELARREARLETIQAAKERLERRKAELAAEAERERQEKLAAKGEDPSGKRRGRKRQSDPARPKAKDQENFTDPDSRIMKSQDGYQQSFNAQAAVDAQSRLIVATGLSNCAADNAELQPMIAAAEANRAEVVAAVEDAPVAPCIEAVLADSGYRCEASFAALEEAGIDAYVAIGREGKEPPKIDREKTPATQRMFEKLQCGGWERYRSRKTIVEPVFGWVKRVLGFRSFRLRGLEKVRGEWNLVCMALNLRRMCAMRA